MIIKKIIAFCLAIAILFSLTVVVFADGVCNHPVKNEKIIQEECNISNENSPGSEDDLMANRYRIVKVYVTTKTYTGWYNNGTYAKSTKMALGISAKKYNVYQENISTGVRNYLYYEYHVTYYWYTRKNTSETAWTIHGKKTGTLRHVITCVEDIFSNWDG